MGYLFFVEKGRSCAKVIHFIKVKDKKYIYRCCSSDILLRSHRLYYVGVLLVFVLFPYMGWELRLMYVFSVEKGRSCAKVIHFIKVKDKRSIYRFCSSDILLRSHRLYYVRVLLVFDLFPYMGWKLRLIYVFCQQI